MSRNAAAKMTESPVATVSVKMEFFHIIKFPSPIALLFSLIVFFFISQNQECYPIFLLKSLVFLDFFSCFNRFSLFLVLFKIFFNCPENKIFFLPPQGSVSSCIKPLGLEVMFTLYNNQEYFASKFVERELKKL